MYAPNRTTRHGHKGNRKIAQVRSRASAAEIQAAASEGVELSREWEYTALITKKQAVRFYNELRNNPFVEAEWTNNAETNPLK